MFQTKTHESFVSETATMAVVSVGILLPFVYESVCFSAR